MYAAKRPLRKPVILFLILASFLLAACTGQLPNQSWPGLSVAGDVVYVASGAQVVAFDVVEQSQLWRFPANGGSAMFFAAPAVNDDGVVVGDFGASGGMFSPKVIVHIYGLTEQPGVPATVWAQNSLASDKIVAPPLIVDNRVFIGTADSEVMALDKATGEPLWAAPFRAGNAIWGQPAYADGVLYVSSLDRHVYAIEPETGTEIGRWETSGAVAGAPVVVGDFIYVGSFDSQLHALDRREYGREIWSFPAADWIWGAPAVADGRLFFGDLQGNFFALDAESGDLVWQKSVTGPVQTSPVVGDGLVYIASQGIPDNGRGQLTAFAIDNGAQLWQQEAPAAVYTTPVIVGNTLVTALHESREELLAGFDRETGSRLWTFSPVNE